jgi:hypothetical protein
LPQRKQKAGRTKKAEPEPQPKRWRQVPAWIWTHFAAGNAIAVVVLGVLFLATATFGTVTNNDVAVAGMLRDPNGKGLVVYLHRPDPAPTGLPALLYLSKTGWAPLCILPAAKVEPSTVRISNRLGKTMQSVLNTLEWAVGLLYEIHFPTTLDAIAKQVRDPNFAQRNLDLLQYDSLITGEMELNSPQCNLVVTTILKKDPNALVCPAIWFWSDPDRKELLQVGVSTFCITLANESKPRLASGENLGHPPLFTRIKIQLGILQAEVEHKGEQ